MLFFLRKLVEAMLMPVGLFGLIVLLAVALRRRSLAIAAVVLICVLSMPVVSRLLMAPLESAYPLQTIAAAPHADAVVVLSGGILRGVSPAGVQWEESANRYFAGLDLAMAGKANLLVLSAGGPPVRQRRPTQGEVLRGVSISRGIQPERIVVTRYVLTTEDEAHAVSELAGIHSVLLVTSAFHMPRAALLFRARGLEVFPFPTDKRFLNPDLLGNLAFLPDSKPLHETEMALREYAGLAVYRTLMLFRPSATPNGSSTPVVGSAP